MANETQSASVASTIQTEVADKLVRETRENTTLGATVYWTSSDVPTNSIVIPRLSVTPAVTDVTAGATEADAIARTQLTTDSVTLTAAVKAIAFLVSKYTMDSSRIGWTEEVPKIAGAALAEALDVAIATLYSGFSSSSGSSGVAMSIATLDAAVTKFNANAKQHAANGIIVVHRKTRGDLTADSLSGAGSSLSAVLTPTEMASVLNLFQNQEGASLLQNMAGSFSGIPIIQTSNVQKINANVDYAGAVYTASRGMADLNAAIAGLLMWAPTVEQFSQGANHIIADSWLGRIAFAVAELRDNLGERLVSVV